jgi:hypothetical protein
MRSLLILVHDGFQNRIDWLAENDNLVLMIDPFSLTDKGSAEKGRINIATLSALLKPCWKKSACVVGFWYSTPQGTTADKKESRRRTSKG